jgi:hypothetical protein
MFRLLLAILAPVSSLLSQVMPLEAVQAGMECEARTVFRGEDPEPFPVRILGTLQRTGPGQNVILGRLMTARLELTGVMQGMSGSPVYCEGKLAGAIAFAFPFAKEPIAGIRPIQEMLGAKAAPSNLRASAIHLGSTELIPSAEAAPDGIREVLTPLSLSGFTANAARHFAASWERLGFQAQQGTAGASPKKASKGLRPGDMISVQLIRGDLAAGADGTVTHTDGDRVYAFGHRFLGGGEVDFPFSKAEVITPLPNLNTSFKISQSLEPLGAIQLDADAAIMGRLGAAPKLAKLRILYEDPAGSARYDADLVRHSVLTPLMLQMAVYSALDHHFRSAGSGTIDLNGTVNYGNGLPPLHIEGRYAGDANLPLAASLGAAIPPAFIQQQAAEQLLPEAIEIRLKAATGRDQWVIERLSLSRRVAKAGEEIAATIALSTGDGRELKLTKQVRLPSWLTPGETLTVTATDAFTANLLDFRGLYQPGGPTFRSASELIETVNSLHPSNAVYLRLHRSSPGFLSGNREMSNLPPSIAASFQRSPGQYLPLYQSRLATEEFLLPSGVSSGSKTITVEIEK